MEIQAVHKIAVKRTVQRGMFSSTEATVMFEVAPDDEFRREQFVECDAVETVINNIPELTNSSTNTDSAEQTSRGMRHYDGGWPNNVDVEEREGRAKHCKKVEREEGYLAACHALAASMKPFLRLNVAIDIFQIYERFNGPLGQVSVSGTLQTDASKPQEGKGKVETNDEGNTKDSITTVVPRQEKPFSVTMKFAAPQANMHVTQVTFTCGSDSDMMVVGYLQGGDARSGSESYSPPVTDELPSMSAAVWSLKSCVAPTHVLYSRSGGCTALACCPKDPLQVVGGCSSGVVQMWDLRTTSNSAEIACANALYPQYWGSSSTTTSHLPVSSSNPLASHRDAVTEAKYVMSKGVDLMTCSIDGRILFWDLRHLQEPLHDETLDLLVTPSAEGSGSGRGHRVAVPRSGAASTTISTNISPQTQDIDVDDSSDASSVDHTHNPMAQTTFTAQQIDYDPLVGGVQQYLVGTAEGFVLQCSRRGRTKGDRILHVYQASLSSVFTAQRCAALPKIFLTVGDWGWRLFGDEVPTPIMSSAPRVRQVTCGRWHPVRPNIVLTGTASGYMEVWDLLHGGVCEPIEELKVSDVALKHCIPHPNGKSVAAADTDGHVYLLTLSDRYGVADPKERSALITLFEREFNRERTVNSPKNNASAPSTEVIHSVDTAQEVFGCIGDVDEILDEDLRVLTEQYLGCTSDESATDLMTVVKKWRTPQFEESSPRASIPRPANRAMSLTPTIEGISPKASSGAGTASMSLDHVAERRRRSTMDFSADAPVLDGTVSFDPYAAPPPSDWVPTSNKKLPVKQKMGRF